MITNELEKCLHIIGYWCNEDKTVIKKLNEQTDIEKQYINPFSKELNINLLNRDNLEAKSDLIKFYLFEFIDLLSFYKTHKKIIDIYYTNEQDIVKKIDEYEHYVVNSYKLFSMLLDEIQICCYKYKIDFFEICNYINFSTEYIDCSITVAFEQIRNKNLPLQPTKPKTDYWKDDADEITLISEYEKAVYKLLEGGDTGCFPMRFRMLPRLVLNENKYPTERKKYILKQMRLILDEVKNTEIGRELFTDLYERIEPYADIFRFVFSETPLPPQPIDEQKPIKYGAKEYALTYIFDLYATGKQVPINRIEGSFDAKKIKQDVSKFPMYDKAPDTFYRAVKSVLEYDLNKPTDLQNISKDWLNAVRNLSTNWVITEQYLKDKNLIGE